MHFERPLANVLGLPTTSTPSIPYDYRDYKNLTVAKNPPVHVVAVYATFGTLYAATNPGQFPFFTSQYSGSMVVSFGLVSLVAGCYQSDANGDAAPPVGCTIRFTGNKASGPVVAQILILSPQRLPELRSAQNLCSRNLISLNVQPIVSAGTAALAGVKLNEVASNLHETG